MRLIEMDALAKETGDWNPARWEFHVRGALPSVRPSALEKQGQPPLAEIGSLLHEVPDFFRYCRLCASMGCEHARVTAQLSRLEMGHRARHFTPVLGCHMCEARP